MGTDIDAKRAQLVDLVRGGDGTVGPRVVPERDDDGGITGYRIIESCPTPGNPDDQIITHVETLEQVDKIIRIGELLG